MFGPSLGNARQLVKLRPAPPKLTIASLVAYRPTQLLILMATNPLPPTDPAGPDATSRLRSFAKYSGIAFQMLATIGLSAWAGTWLDGHFHSKNPLWTIGLMLFGVLAALYQVIRGLTKGS